jgi:hypothetical protein
VAATPCLAVSIPVPSLAPSACLPRTYDSMPGEYTKWLSVDPGIDCTAVCVVTHFDNVPGLDPDLTDWFLLSHDKGSIEERVKALTAGLDANSSAAIADGVVIENQVMGSKVVSKTQCVIQGALQGWFSNPYKTAQWQLVPASIKANVVASYKQGDPRAVRRAAVVGYVEAKLATMLYSGERVMKVWEAAGDHRTDLADAYVQALACIAAKEEKRVTKKRNSSKKAR